MRRTDMRRRVSSALWLSLSVAVLALPVPSQAQVVCISNNIPPPELPVYEQPPIPDPGYIWTPGYWAGGPSGYFWVPGTWVQPPDIGLLWTPGYWAWRDGIYTWQAGYWGPHVGFYGGIDYGFGYIGAGYEGGRWDGGVFAYNRTVNNLGGVVIANVYEKTVVVDPGAVRVSFNGGSGGATARPTPEQEAAAHEQHVAAIPEQSRQERMASSDKALLASENRGHPAIAATGKPGEFTGKAVTAAREATPVGTPEMNRRNDAGTLGTNQTGAKPFENNPARKEERPGEATLNKPGEPTLNKPGEATLNKPGEPALNKREERPGEATLNKPGEEAPLHGGTPSKLVPEGRPLNNEGKQSNTGVKPPTGEAKLPGMERKQEAAPVLKQQVAPQPRLAVTPHPAVVPHQPPANARPANKEKKPPA
jgi:hypothetical protein